MTTFAKSGFFKAAFDAIVAANERRASRYVNGALLSLDDETLRAVGHSREELSKRSRAYYVD